MYQGKPEDEAIDTYTPRASFEPVDEGTLVRLRKDPLEANQVLPWSVLENAGAPVTVRGFGMLFDDRQPDGNKTEER